jgi:DNA-binding NarL/FixJ family response regulator
MRLTDSSMVLVVDDHPMTSDAYINLIKNSSSKISYEFLKADSCESAFKTIEVCMRTGKKIDIAMIDINLPAFPAGNILSGADIARIVRKRYPECIVIILTMHYLPLLLNDILKSISPEGFISKNDIDFEIFPELFERIASGEVFFSASINRSLHGFLKKSIKWDAIDTQIILLLDKGVKTKEMPLHINLSLSSIEKRKAYLKTQLLDQKATDEALISKCRVLQLI